MFKRIIKTIALGVTMLFVLAGVSLPAHAGIPHTSFGIVSGGVVGDSWHFYLVNDPSASQDGALINVSGAIVYQVTVGNIEWSDGGDSLVFMSRETGAGTNSHTGYYAVMNEDLDETDNPQRYNDCTMRQIPVPTASAGSGVVNLSWTAAQADTSATPHGNNIAGYNVYRSTSQASGFTQINSSLVTGTNHTDSSGAAGTTYYYTIELVFRGGVALGVYSANSNGVEFPAPGPRVTGISPNSGTQGDTLDVTITGADTSWSGDMASAVHFSGTGITINSATAASATSINANITIASDATTDARTVTVDGASGSAPFTVNPPGGLNITSILPATAEVGQTVVISGTNFGASMGSSAVRFGTTIANPTSWSATSITVAVPAGFSAGDVNVVVQVNSVDSNTATIAIAGQKIYIEDYEGGAVGSFTSPATQSGYYVFENSDDIIPINNDINAQLRQTEAAHDGVYGAKVKYSFIGTDGTDWGGGWGAKLANVLDLENTDQVSLFINWDGSTNDVTINLKDSDGTANAATISNATLTALTGYGEVTIDKSSFALDEAGSDTGHDGSFDWSEIAGYNFVYTTDGTSTNYHYIDTITANLVEVPTGEGIYRIEPPAGPAGTRVTIIGNGFGDVQGMSDLIFENIDTGAWYAADDIISWNNNQIVALVPEPAAKGNYKVKVIRVTIIQETGDTQAWQSNDVDFRVTATAAGEGGMATIRPNPFNPLASGANAQEAKAANIAFSNSEHRTVGIYIYDMTARLVYHNVTTGSEVSWSGYDTHDNLVGDGAYILRVVDEQSKRLIAKGKILVIKKK